MTASRAQALARNPECREILARMTESEKAALQRDWRFHARPEQILDDALARWWAIVTGRGWGKNRTGSEWSLDRCEQFAAARKAHLLALINATYTEVRALQIGGESGIEACAAMRGHVVDIPASKLEGRIRVWDEGWQDTDVEIHTAEKPQAIRGRNLNSVWSDELAKHKQVVDPEGGTAFSNADFALRAICPPGVVPQGCVTTTPKPIQVLRDLLAGKHGRTRITRGSLLDNVANLDPSFVQAILNRYAGSRLGAQEIEGILLEYVEGALWSIARIETTRVKILVDDDVEHVLSLLPPLVSVVVGVDPSGSKENGTCGIVVAGMAWLNGVPHLYVLEDASGHLSADEWAARAVDRFWRWRADAIVFETNYGGDMGPTLIGMVDSRVPCRRVTATRGKAVRAEPVATLWSPEQQRGHIVGWMPETEEQLTTWVPGDASPDRLDALVWCGYGLIGDLTAIDQAAAYGSAVADARI